MLRTWLEPEQMLIPDEYLHAIGGNPLVSQVLYSRGYTDLESAQGFLTPENYHPAPAAQLPGLQAAVELLTEAIHTKKVIGVWGDFDVDGQTSTTILVSALRQLGAKALYHIPVRAEESHGISIPPLQTFIQQGIDLLITCDTGISSHDAIEFAQKNGVPVIITDHHDLPEILPGATAIVNPKFLSRDHPLALLPGVGVAYKILEELFDQIGDPKAAQQFLDLVALGLVADIAVLRADNRYLLQLGLEALRHTRRTGLQAIMELAELNAVNLSEEHIAYILAPRMNALGRLDDANSMVELLTTSDSGRARVLALELEGMNAHRKLLSDQVYQAAQAQLNTDPKLLELPVLVLSHPSWPAGVIGIVASRLVEQYHRPVILLSTPPGQDARGSARSIEGVNITSAIATNPALVKTYGGHPMAAGLAMDPVNISDFHAAIARTVHEMGVEVQAEKDLHIDGYLSLPELSLELVDDLERLAPFGAGNPPLVFATRDLKLTGYAAVGRTGEHLQLTLEDELGHIQRSIWWQGSGYTLPESKFDLAFSVRASTYRGQRDVQIEWIDYRQVEALPVSLIKKKPPIDVIDMRSEPDPLLKLKQLEIQEQLLVWGEALANTEVTCLDRFSLHPAQILAIWTIPPGSDELQSVVHSVDPVRIYLFAINPDMDAPDSFLKRLVGVLKSRIKSFHGRANLSILAAATAQRIQTIRVGLEWLHTNGYLKIISIDGNEVLVSAGSGERQGDTKPVSGRLNALLAESAAYRRYYLSAHKDHIVQLVDDV